MITESARALGFLPQFSKLIRSGPVAGNKLFSTGFSSQSEESKEKTNTEARFDKFRYIYPEFLPQPLPKYRNAVREKLERRDMLRRRNSIYIPEFYVGSIVAVSTSDKHVPKKNARFVGICIQKRNFGLQSTFLLRNIIENQGVEVMYYQYSPLIQRIQVLRLEKRLDEELLYLREAPNEYSTFPMDMLQEYRDPDAPVPVNTLKVPLNPPPWHQRFERMDLKGVILPQLPEKTLKRKEAAMRPWEKYDLMDQYRQVVPEEDQRDIFMEISDELKEIELKQKSKGRKKEFTKPTRQKLF